MQAFFGKGIVTMATVMPEGALVVDHWEGRLGAFFVLLL